MIEAMKMQAYLGEHWVLLRQKRSVGFYAFVYLFISQCSSISAVWGRSSLLDLGDPSNASKTFIYADEGDFNIGAVFSVHLSGENTPCGVKLRESGVVQYTEAIAFAIDQINHSPHILRDYKLGFVVFDDCMNPQTALAQTLHFFPMDDRPNSHCYEKCRSSTNGHRFYDVVGVIGAENSPASMVMGNVLGIFQIPQISPSSTSDLLSDKTKYPYFMRMMPPDRFQVQAILDLLLHFNWTYVAMVYSKGGYGEEAVKRLKKLAGNHSICIGATIAITNHAREADYSKIVSDLYMHRAKIVVLFIDQEEAREIFKATKRESLIGRFVWVGSDGIGFNTDDFDGIEEAAVGTLTLRPYSPRVREFESYFESLFPSTSKNPWLGQMWEELFNCKLGRTCNGTENITVHSDYFPEAIVANIIDSVYTFAHALHKLIQDKPRHACRRRGGKVIPDCVTGKELIEYLKNVSFTGITGNISFDKNGDILGRYEVVNFQKSYKVVSVGLWEVTKGDMIMNESLITWASHTLSDNQTIPDSSGCGKKCGVGEIYAYLKNTCCWNCRSCAHNQITTEEATRCLDCSEFYWPNANHTECVRIVPMYIGWGDPVVFVTAALSLFGVLLTVVITLVFFKNNDARIIKATSRELTYIMLSGVFIQYLLVFTYITKPQAVICVFNYIGFNVSFSVVYAALLTRTNRIFRIFNAGKKTKVLPSLTSPLSQVLIAVILIGLQIIITVTTMVFSPPGMQERMQMALKTELGNLQPEVELTCSIPVQGFIISLCYNLLLVFICTVYAFKTRMLPDNFNESRCITLCVYTTLVIWLAFLPTYFTTTRAYFQVILVSSALILNATVTLLCLYVPRICALRAEHVGGPNNKMLNTFKYTTQGPQGVLIKSRLEATGASNVEEQATELSDYGGASYT